MRAAAPEVLDVAPDWVAPSTAGVEPTTETKEVEVVTPDTSMERHAAKHGIDLNESPEAINARIARGDMHFEDFYGVNQAMQGQLDESESALSSVPTGYEKIIQVMTAEERLTPSLFVPDAPMSEMRIERLAKESGVPAGRVATFVRDFGGLQEFFANVVVGGKSRKAMATGLLGQSARAMAEKMSNKPRQQRRLHEKRSMFVREAGRELRREQGEARAAKAKKAKKGFR